MITNASSHSITLATEDKEFVLDTIYPNEDGNIVLTGGEFGWDFFKYNDALSKANYAAVDFFDSQEYTDLLIDVIKEQTGAINVLLNFSKSYNSVNWSYIDHESVGLVPRNKEELKNFIFNKNSWLFGGNDNSYPSSDFYVVPEFKNGTVFEPKFKYELVIDGIDETVKFLEYPDDEELSKSISSLMNEMIVSYDGEIIRDTIELKINRRQIYYEFNDWSIKQDYSTKNIILLAERNKYNEINQRLSSEGKSYDERCELITNELLKIPNQTLIIKFSINEIFKFF